MSRLAALMLLAALVPRVADGQTPAPPPQSPPARDSAPGPYVIDIRGTTIRVPQTSNFYPDISGETVIPARGFGLQAGAHVYPLAVGTRRIGFGVDLFMTRGTATTPPTSVDNGDGTTTVETFPDVAVSMRIVAPQLSLNFGTSRGWSYLSAGAGPARVKSTAAGRTTVTSRVSANAGAGARWFITDHVGVGFDLRGHWVGSRALFGASAGFSVK